MGGFLWSQVGGVTTFLKLPEACAECNLQTQTHIALHFCMSGQQFASQEASSIPHLRPCSACTGSGDLELVERFILLGLSISDQSQNGWDVLMWACLGGHAAVVSKLLSLGSNIGAKDAEQRLGLHWAAEKGHAEAVGVLVKQMLQANLDIQAQVRLVWQRLV